MDLYTVNQSFSNLLFVQVGIEHYNSLNDMESQSYYQTKLTQLIRRDHLQPHFTKNKQIFSIGGIRSVEAKKSLSGQNSSDVNEYNPKEIE